MFNFTSRIGNDYCGLDQRNVQNVKSGNYSLTNFYPDVPIDKALQFATNQPSMFINGGHQMGYNGCNVDYNSQLTMSDLSKPSYKISLYERPFLTVPYLGKGPHNPVLESHLQQGDTVSNKKSIGTISELNHNNIHNYPMLPNVQATIANPANLIESVAEHGWIRGGLPSRELTRDQDYNSNR